ncbi:Phosphoserine phosphatase RsbU [Gimesia panareensis]|uniref:Phosphoserine phosphatase RsbU n=2 Tax=Gimesia panareensis TaxID=2527978 RepID=A0A518FNK9_9PLAN|nr:Phosphoserine phosphatase RsbU [Gimesia panareensis]
MVNSGPQTTINMDPPQQPRPKRTIRFQLLLVVNTVLGIFVVVFLLFSYQRDLAARLNDKRIALEEEAATIVPTILEMRHEGQAEIQEYINTIHKQMQEIHAPEHHIVVSFDNQQRPSISDAGQSEKLIAVILQAAESTGNLTQLHDSEIMVGTFHENGVRVSVSETVDNVYGAVLSEVLNRLTGFIVLAFITGIVINLALTYIVTRPLDQLMQTVQMIGQGQLGTQSETFHSMELNYLTHEINSMSASLAAVDKVRQRQMNKARKIQENLHPRKIQVPGLEVATIYHPADEVGGDYYDVLHLENGAWLFCVADITGHGISAAMSAAVLKTLLIQASEHSSAPAEIMEFINRRFTVISPVGEFVSMQLISINPDTHAIEYASAGHEPACLLTATGEISDSETTGLLVGIEKEASWNTISLQLKQGDRLLMLTDGVSETHNPAGEMFGRKRMAALFKECQHLPVAETAEQIRSQLSHFRAGGAQQDDITILLLEMTAPDPEEN